MGRIFVLAVAIWSTSSLAAVDELSPSQVSQFVKRLGPHRTLRLTKNAPTVSLAEIRKAAAGSYVSGIRIIEEVAAAQGYGVAVYDLPIAEMWKAITDEPHAPAHVPVAHSIIVRGTARKSPRSLFQYLEVPILSDRWWVTALRHNPALFEASKETMWELSWRDATHSTDLKGTPAAGLVDGGIPVAWTHGSWLLIALPDGRTYTEYYVWTDPGGKLPAGPASRFAGGKIKETLDGMRRMAQEHIPQCGEKFSRPDGALLP
jgi:hypothetical protein